MKDYIPIVVFVVLGVVTAIVFNRKFKSVLVATGLATVTTSLLFQLWAVLNTGFGGPFFLAAFVNSLPISLIITGAVGLAVLYRRRK